MLAIFLRVYKLDKVPIELFGDEIDVGIQANSILHTGKDYFGNKFPVMFHSFDEYRLPLFIYSDVLFIKIFGLNEWGVRMAGVFWGVLGILGLYLLCKKLTSPRIALFSAFLLAITPWHLQYSRQAGIESGMLLTFTTLAIWAFIKGLQNFKWLLISAIIFSLSIYVYATALVFVVIFGTFLLVFFRRSLQQYGVAKLGFITIVCFIILIPYINIYLQGKAGARFSTISIFGDKDINDEIFIRRNRENGTLATVFHNKPFAYSQEIIKNYVRTFSTEFLFTNGDPNLRQSVGGVGEFYVFEILLLFFGLYHFLKFKDGKNISILFFWILIAPIPSSLTKDGGYHASRLMLILTPLIFFMANGMDYLIAKRPTRWVKVICGIFLFLAILNIAVYMHRYYVEWPKDSWRFWQLGYKEAMEYIKDNDSRYERIYFNNTYESTLPRFLFWYGYDPKTFQNQVTNIQKKENIIKGFNGFSVGNKYYFGIVSKLIEDEGFAEVLQKNDLYLVSVRDEVGAADWISSPPKHVKILKTIYNPFNKPIFFIITKKV